MSFEESVSVMFNEESVSVISNGESVSVISNEESDNVMFNGESMSAVSSEESANMTSLKDTHLITSNEKKGEWHASNHPSTEDGLHILHDLDVLSSLPICLLPQSKRSS